MRANKFFANLVLLSSALIFISSISFSFAVRQGVMDGKAGVNSAREVYGDQYGNPVLATGSCQEDSNCVPGGCSNQICTSDVNLATTCEFSESFPNLAKYSCGCVNQRCAWYSGK